jgi:hypothetical protein
MRDAIAGERAVKEAGPTYLPIPPGMPNLLSEVLENGKRVGSDPYAFYLGFADFPEIVEPAHAGFQGVVHARPPVCKLPKGLEYLIEMCCPDGTTLEELWSAVTSEVMCTGRIGLLIDVDTDQRLRAVPYSVENNINWRERSARNGGGADFVVLKEPQEEQGKDAFHIKSVTRYRELRLNNGVYQSRVWEEKENDDKSGMKLSVVGSQGNNPEGWTTIIVSGKTLNFIPFYPLNSAEITFCYQSIPMLPLARRAFTIYRKTADYNRALYIKADPQICIAGIGASEAPQKIGGDGVWTFDSPDVKAWYLDIDGQGIPLMRQSIKDEYDRFDMEGGKLLATDKTAPESGTALRQRQMAQQVTLRNIVTNLGLGFETVLKQIAFMSGLDPESVSFSPDTDFAEPTMTSQELMELITAKNIGAPMSYSSMHELMRRGSLTQKSFLEEVDAIEEESATLASIIKPEPTLPEPPVPEGEANDGDKENGKDAPPSGTAGKEDEKDEDED